jgi:amino-acid N-acetyltransferase
LLNTIQYMNNQIDITLFNHKYREALVSLLQSEGLPVEDLPQDLSNFYMATDNGFIVGAIGLEIYERSGLLRSLVVKPEYRKMKIAKNLVSELERQAKNKALSCIYLLTETARDYFSKIGFEETSREEAPVSLKQSTEFSHVCPSTAIFMKKKI